MWKWRPRLLGGNRIHLQYPRSGRPKALPRRAQEPSMKLWNTARPALLSAVAAALLAACGGGNPQEPQGAILGAQDSLGNPQSASITAAPQAADTDGKRPARSTPAKVTNKVWIVQLAEPPVAGYTGGISGLAATKP